MATKRLADVTVNEASGLTGATKKALVERIAALTGRTLTDVSAALKTAKVNTRLEDAFKDWPRNPEHVRSLTASRALTLDLAQDLAPIGPMSVTQMRKALNAAAPQTRVSTVFNRLVEDGEALRSANRERPAPPPKPGSTQQRSTKLKTTQMAKTQTLPATTRKLESTTRPVAAATRKAPSTTRSVAPATTKPAQRVAPSTAPNAKRAAGMVVGDYTLVEKLDVGGFGEVWLAKKKGARGAAAHVLKFRRHDRADGRLRQEWESARLLNHRNICRPLALLEKAHLGEDVLVLKYAGQSLDRHLGARAATSTELLHITRQVGAALHHAHDNDVLHLDLAANNVLIDQASVVRLTDFGSARIASAVTNAQGNGTKAASRAIAFHPATAAPEMMMGHQVSRRSDVFGLAALLALLANPALSRNRPIPRDVGLGHLPPAFAQAITRGLEYEPSRRFASVKQFAAAVVRALA